MQYGTSSAKSSTLSFWVNSSVTGTYGITFYSQCSQSRALNVTYTIDSANTWEHKTITIVGDTGEAHADDNTLGIMIVWSLASGSNYDSVNSTSWANYTTTNLNGGHQQDGVVTTDDAVFYLTGVQWEIGTSSTPFEHRPIGTELNLCNRYFQQGPLTAFPVVIGTYSTYFATNFRFSTPMRATPSFTFFAPSSGNSGKIEQWGGTEHTVSSVNVGSNNAGVPTNEGIQYVIISSGIAVSVSLGAIIKADAEL